MRECRQTHPTGVPKSRETRSLDSPQFLSSNNPPTGHNNLVMLPGHDWAYPISDTHTNLDITDSHTSDSQLPSRRSAGAPPPVSLPCSSVHVVDPPQRHTQGQHNRQLRFTAIPEVLPGQQREPAEDASLPCSPKRLRPRREQTPWSSPQPEEEEEEDILYSLPQDADIDYGFFDWCSPSNQLFTY